MSYSQHMAEDARLVILRALAKEVDYRLNESLLEKVLDSFGHRATRTFVRDQMRWLEREVQAVTITEAGSVLVATITRRGLDHVERKTIIEGVARPSPEV